MGEKLPAVGLKLNLLALGLNWKPGGGPMEDDWGGGGGGGRGGGASASSHESPI